MAKTASARATSKGICKYCKGEIEKGKMTQHLKFCKQRIASFKTTEGSEKTRLFHLLVEGSYLPMYWMHLEVPADATLADVDGFLRAIWLECCGHLSAFRIGKASYSSHRESMSWGPEEVELDEVTEEEEAEPDDLEAELAELSPIELADRLNELLSEEFGANVADLSVEELEVKLTDLFVKRAGGSLPSELQSQMGTIARFVKWSTMFQDTFEDRVQEYGMDIELGKVLTVGQKFSYTYDFGSSTELSLRVQAEREGIVTEDEDLIEVMARNESPDLVCEVCGKPATKVINEYIFLCDTCTKNRKRGEYGDMVLPVVNSPRAGVCGYTGSDYKFGWDEDDEEEYEEDEETE